jgi:hypothetical protein
MVEKTLIVIIAAVFVLSSWWWSHRQSATEGFYEVQLRERDAAIAQLRTMALPLIQGKSREQVQRLVRDLYPQLDITSDDSMVAAGFLRIRFSEDDTATDFWLPWDAVAKPLIQ